MSYTLAEIGEHFGLKVEGDPALTIEGLCGLTDDLPGRLSFIGSPKLLEQAARSRIDAFITKPGMVVEGKVNLYSDDPEYAIAQIAEWFRPAPMLQDERIHPGAVIGNHADLGEAVRIGPGVILGRHVRVGDHTEILAGTVIMDHVVIGENCLIHPNVTIREHCSIGDRVILQPGVVIGGDGYGYLLRDGEHKKIPQIGGVIIDNDVEIGANATVDRGRFLSTRVGRGTKIDNFVHVAHNVQVGEHCLLVSHVAIAGSTKLGNHVTLAGQVGLVHHIDIADGVTVLGQSMVTKSINEKGVWAGSPAQPADLWRRSVALAYKQARKR
ncbi:UDP-3-O-(3-hydroxymyristoyl)glucosamine N-acyltransferase [Thiohalomonas denitrificans]|uniref:UDP-3-O-(3-hydroxymyristoyl)glucosamine N-acyltransferase n=1 Tax=Thiohalomonas denitrificans TaxID=415747 RepID=UPI0026F14704|nr:UDP-3-O-(3-hydroxymyristoyl)glucosamine N-acyltransferase [Thiohalomonas denitrificans]